MRDDFYSKDWADNHLKLSDPIHKFFESIGEAFARLNAIQFDAPWRRVRRDRQGSSAC